MKDLKAFMRVTVKDRTESFVFLYYSADPKRVLLLNEETNNSESIKINMIEKVVDQDIRVPKIPMDVLVDHLVDVNFGNSGADEDIYAVVCDAMIMRSRVQDFFQQMIDRVDFEELEHRISATKQ